MPRPFIDHHSWSLTLLLRFILSTQWCNLSHSPPHYRILFYSTPPIWQRLEGWQWLTQAPPPFICPLPRSVPEKKKTQGVPLSIYPLDLVDPLLPPRFIHPPPRKKTRRIPLSVHPLGRMDPLLPFFPLQSNAGTIGAVLQIIAPFVPLQILRVSVFIAASRKSIRWLIRWLLWRM